MDWNSQDPMGGYPGTFVLPGWDGGSISTLEEAGDPYDRRDDRRSSVIRPYNHRDGEYARVARQAAPATAYGDFTSRVPSRGVPDYPPPQAGAPPAYREYFASRGDAPGAAYGADHTTTFHTSRRGQADLFAMSSPERPARGEPGTQPDYSQLAYAADAHSGMRPSPRGDWPTLPVYSRFNGYTGGGGYMGVGLPNGCSGGPPLPPPADLRQKEGFAAGGGSAAASLAADQEAARFHRIVTFVILLVLLVLVAMIFRTTSKVLRRQKKLKALFKRAASSSHPPPAAAAPAS